MESADLARRISVSELVFTSSRSSGPGGQNVNKVSSKVELRFNISLCKSLTEDEKNMIRLKLKKRITNEDELLIISQSERTQLANKKKCIEKFYSIIELSLEKKPSRRSGRPTYSSVMSRLQKKKLRGNIKKLRRESRGRNED
jgi:ribosome-associated protein